MDKDPNANNKKRDANYMHAQELQWKLKSKADFVAYLDQHRKCLALSCPGPRLNQQADLIKLSSVL